MYKSLKMRYNGSITSGGKWYTPQCTVPFGFLNETILDIFSSAES